MEVIQQLNKTGIRIQELINLFPDGWPSSGLDNLREHYRSLKLAQAWTLKAMIVLNPEASFENEEESFLPEDWKQLTSLGRVDYVLQAIDKIIEELPNYEIWSRWFIQEHIYSKCDSMSKDNYHTFEEEAFKNIPDWQWEISGIETNLIEAKMFLGFEILDYKDKL